MIESREILYLSAKERDEFWRCHAESRKRLDEEYAKLSLTEKLKLQVKLRRDAELLRKTGK